MIAHPLALALQAPHVAAAVGLLGLVLLVLWWER